MKSIAAFVIAIFLSSALVSAQANNSRTSISEVRTKNLHALRYDLGTTPNMGELLRFPGDITGWVTIDNFDHMARTVEFRVSAPTEIFGIGNSTCDVAKQNVLRPGEVCSFVFWKGRILVYWGYAEDETGMQHVVLYIAKTKKRSSSR